MTYDLFKTSDYSPLPGPILKQKLLKTRDWTFPVVR